MAAPKKTNQKGPEVHKKTDNRLGKQYLFVGAEVIFAALGFIAAGLWVSRSLDGEEAAAIFTLIAAALSKVIINNLTKYKAFFERVETILFIFCLSFGIGLFVGKIVVKSGMENIPNSEESGTIGEDTEGYEGKNEVEYEDEHEEEYVAKTFIYEEDVLLIDLVYYIDGHEIRKEDKKTVLKSFINENLFCGKLPERYENSKEKLNSGVYAKKTQIASDYFESYKFVKDSQIEEEDKLSLANSARKNRKEADNEYVTIENNRNLVWACEATRQELWLCIDGTSDDRKISEWKEESRECNREIMVAVWNILQIEFCLGMEISKDMVDELIEAYEWERDHMPEKNVNYDELINAFNDVLSRF